MRMLSRSLRLGTDPLILPRVTLGPARTGSYGGGEGRNRFRAGAVSDGGGVCGGGGGRFIFLCAIPIQRSRPIKLASRFHFRRNSMLSRRGAFVRLLSLGLLLACGGDSSGPDDPGPAAALTAVSGGTQTGVVGSTLPQPVVVKVADAQGRGVPGVAVNFRIDSGNGTLAPAVDSTDASGQAQTIWTLGTELDGRAASRCIRWPRLAPH